MAERPPAAPVSASAPAAAAAPAPAMKAPDLPFVKYTLPNGLEVILSEDHRLPLVAVNIWYHVGPIKERAGRTGFAHLFEHMMFEGSKNVGEKAHIKYVESAGASEINGTTSFDRTNYFETLPSNQLALGLWLESDRMGFLLDTLDAKKLQNQRDVVRNERRQSIENAPYGIVDEAVYHELFPAGHPYYPDVMGSHADVEAARIADIRDFFKHFYTPNNATLAIVGDFKMEDAKALIEKYFGPIPRGPEVAKTDTVTPPITSERRLVVTDQVQLPKVILAWLTPVAYTPEDAIGDNLAHILGEGRSSRLYRALVYDKQIAQTVGCEHSSQQLGSPLICEIVARPGVKAEDLEKAAEAEVEKLRAEPPTQAEVDGARNTSETGIISQLESVTHKADELNEFNQYTGNPGFLPEYIRRIDAITPADDQKFAQAYLGASQRVVVYGLPGAKELHDVPRSPDSTDADYKFEPEYKPKFYTAQAFRKEAPKAGPELVFHLPVPQTFTLANGLQVYLVEQHDLPIFSAELVTLAGSESDPKDRFGVASYAAAMLRRGTATRSSTQIAAEADGLGAQLTTAAGGEDSAVNVSALSRNIVPVMDLMADVALHPAFDTKEVERARGQRLTGLVQMRDESQALAFTLAPKGLFGPDSARGHLALGTETSLKAMTAADLRSFYTAHYSPRQAALVIVGDVTAAQARQLAETRYGAWSGPALPESESETVPAVSPRVIAVDVPNAPQSVIVAVGNAPARDTPEFPQLQTLNSALGGLFSSRINMNLREEHGYTYGAFSVFEYGRHDGVFYSGAEVRADVTVPALEQLSRELHRIGTDPLSEQELTASRQANVRVLPGVFVSTGEIAGQIAELWLYKLPVTYFRDLPARLESVTSAQVQAAANEHIRTGQMFYVVVGDKKQYADTIGKLNLGKVEYWSTDGFPLK